MAGEWKLGKGEFKFVESIVALGTAIGLVNATGVQSGGSSCRGSTSECVGNTMSGLIQPYISHAASGALIGLTIAFGLVYLWRWRNASRPAREGAPVRRAIPERVRHEVWRRDRGTCVECGSRARLEFDHIVPVSRGGSNSARNVELRCEPCNRRKGARI
jgi:hypothetical protein